MIINICQKWILSISIIILTNHVAFITCPYKCGSGTNSNYTTNSTYSTNLNTLLSSLPSNLDITGFYAATAGQTPDAASAIILCRGDILLDTCRECAQNATVQLQSFCPSTKQAIIWRELCMLRYSDVPILGALATIPSYWLWNRENTTSAEVFKGVARELIGDLLEQAALGGSGVKLAAGSREAPDRQIVYALVQCTPDLTPVECRSCLRAAEEDLPRCCDWKKGAGIYLPSCNLRYETFQFYNQITFGESLPSPPRPGNGGKKTSRNVIIIVIPIVGCLILVAAISIFLIRRRTKHKSTDFLTRRTEQKSTQTNQIYNAESLEYDFEIIRDATNDFSEANKLGKGGFGPVYKGKLVNGQEIAVKRLSTGSKQGDLEFKNEVLLGAGLQHKNLVKLLGFCQKETERILIYEFVRNASLDQFVFDPIRRREMDWETRYKIIGGIAKGLVYLHEDSRLKIIHRDLKVSNVLLDAEMNPKIADFGLARLVVQDETHGSTCKVAGTFGYMPPEYIFQGHFSIKSDVFSFGVMALEIISGQKNSKFRDKHQNVEHLLSYAWRNWQEKNGENVIDPFMRNSSGFQNDILRCIHIALLCVQDNITDRPTMASVVQMMNNSSLTMSLPTKPGFFLPGRLDSEDTENTMEMEESRQCVSSRNDASVTEMYPR